MDTLILNKDAAPISVLPLSAVSWQEAIKYMFLDRVVVLEWYDDWVVHSANWETRVPAVIMVKDYIRKSRHARFSKYNVTLRDRFECQYCHTTVVMSNVTMDHVYPISLGGRTSWENIVAACAKCNSTKGSKLIKPIKQPYQPTYYELVNIRKSLPFEVKHPSWSNYI
jgi:5-methylcytosine-specific restriction endonuclease McrA